MNIIDILITDHHTLIDVMNQLINAIEASSDECDQLFRAFRTTFDQHDDAEENILYPALKQINELKRIVLKGFQAHHVVKVGILELRLLPYTSESWGPKFSVVRDSILLHMEEEEEKLFPLAQTLLSANELEKFGDILIEQRL